MSSRVRRVALGLATLTLLTSLFTVIQGFVDPPGQALAACEVMYVNCSDQFRDYRPWECCCHNERYHICLCRICDKINLDCSVTYDVMVCDACYCAGYWCRCQ